MEVSAEYKLDNVCFLQIAEFADFPDYRTAHFADEALAWSGISGVL